VTRAVDVGIVTANPEAMIGFYRDVLGLEDLGELKTSSASVRQLRYGANLVKLVTFPSPPSGRSPGGGIPAATGYRYCTIRVTDLDEVVAACRRAGRPVVVPAREIAAGTRVAIIEDPDGNWVEFMTEPE
jgi:catechol 2,3-dioxygenase-like lactoylglutathione lyase family enzyme